MKRKRVLIVVIAVAVIAIMMVAAGLIWFFSPGVQLFWRFAHLDVQETGYMIDPETMELTGQTDVMIKGTSHAFHVGDFSGEVRVSGFENTEPGEITPWGIANRMNAGFYRIFYGEEYFLYPAEDGGSKIGQCENSYFIFLHPDRSDLLLIKVTAGSEDTYIVCAEDEQAAIENFQWAIDKQLSLQGPQ